MKTMMESICYFLILSKLAETQNDLTVTDVELLVENVQKFYLARSIFVVYDRRHLDFNKETFLLNIIKRHSRQYSMSQAITYQESNELSKHRENVLYFMTIFNMKNLQLAINVTKNIDMSLHPWLLIFSDNSDFDCNKPGKEFFKLRMDTQMTAKCAGNKYLKRYYSVTGDRTDIMDLAEWTPEKKLKFKDSQELHKVGSNMKGVILKLGVRDADIEEANEHLTKFLSNLMRELEKFGNFKTKVTIRDANLGYFDNKTNSWSGLTNLVHKNQVDIGMSLFSMTRSRLNRLDFAAPIARSRYYLFAKLPEIKTVNWVAYFKAFDLYTWIAVVLSVLTGSVILTVTRNACQGNLTSNFFRNFVNVWGICCQQGIVDPPSNTSIQIIYFSLLIMSLILNAFYSAIITSYITLLSPTLPFSTYEEFKRDTTYEVTVLKNSGDEYLIHQYDYFEPLKSRLKIPCELPVDPYEGFEQACEPNTAFYSDEVTLDGIKYGPPCKLGRLDIRHAEYMSVILAKNSPYTKTISSIITRLRDHGVLKRLKNKYFYKYTELPYNQPTVITFKEVLPIMAVWIIGVILTFIVCLFELIVFYLPVCDRFINIE